MVVTIVTPRATARMSCIRPMYRASALSVLRRSRWFSHSGYLRDEQEGSTKAVDDVVVRLYPAATPVKHRPPIILRTEPTLETPEPPVYSASSFPRPANPARPIAQQTSANTILHLVNSSPPPVPRTYPPREIPGVGQDLHVLGVTLESGFFTANLKDKFDHIREVITDPLFTNVRPRKVKHTSKIEATAPDDGGPISNLLVTGLTPERYINLKAIKDRIGKWTTIFIVNEGLGFAESLNATLFRDPNNRPSYVMGLVEPRLMWDRDHPEKTRTMRTRLTTARPTEGYLPDHREDTNYLLESITSTPALQAIVPSYDRWLYYKLQRLIFLAVVDPVCVALDCTYHELGYNNWGRRMVELLANDMAKIIQQLPELYGSEVQTLLLKNDNLYKSCLAKIASRHGATSKMVIQVRRGLPTDIDFINGYFVRRAKQLNMKVPAMEFAVAMVKAKHYHVVRLADEIIPWDPVPEVGTGTGMVLG